MPDQFISPNLHVILIHYPLAMITVGTLIELFAFLWRRSSFRVAGRWMILIGVIALGPALTTGLYAMGSVNRSTSVGDDASWADVRAASPVQGHAWEMMRHHGWYLADASVVLVLLSVIWLACSDRVRSKFHLIFLLALLISVGLMVAGAWNGGEMIYRHGVAVQPAGATAGQSADASSASRDATLAYYAPPLQTHVILAGLLVTLSLVSIGLSLRAGAEAGAGAVAVDDEDDIRAALDPTARSAVPRNAQSPLNPLPATTAHVPGVARFWVIALLLALAAVVCGAWTLAHLSDTWNLHDLIQMVTDHDTAGGYRRLAHVILGCAIVVLLLIIAIIARVAVARRALLSIFIILLVLAVGWQVWIGSLLLLDTPSGSLMRFNSASAATTTP